MLRPRHGTEDEGLAYICRLGCPVQFAFPHSFAAVRGACGVRSRYEKGRTFRSFASLLSDGGGGVAREDYFPGRFGGGVCGGAFAPPFAPSSSSSFPPLCRNCGLPRRVGGGLRVEQLLSAPRRPRPPPAATAAMSSYYGWIVASVRPFSKGPLHFGGRNAASCDSSTDRCDVCGHYTPSFLPPFATRIISRLTLHFTLLLQAPSSTSGNCTLPPSAPAHSVE